MSLNKVNVYFRSSRNLCCIIFLTIKKNAISNTRFLREVEVFLEGALVSMSSPLLGDVTVVFTSTSGDDIVTRMSGDVVSAAHLVGKITNDSDNETG